MTWFENLTGCVEESPERVREHLFISERRLCSRLNGRSWLCGELETPTLAQLRERVRNSNHNLGPSPVARPRCLPPAQPSSVGQPGIPAPARAAPRRTSPAAPVP